MILLFVVTSFIQLPASIQDMVMGTCNLFVYSYILVGIAQLYQISPAVGVAPIVAALIVIHFIIKWNAKSMPVMPESGVVPLRVRSEAESSEPGLTGRHKNRRQSVAEAALALDELRASEAIVESSVEGSEEEMVMNDSDLMEFLSMHPPSGIVDSDSGFVHLSFEAEPEGSDLEIDDVRSFEYPQYESALSDSSFSSLEYQEEADATS